MVLGLLLSVNAYAANEGSGPIEFPPKFEKRFKDYLGHVVNKKQYKFAFAFHPDGANDWQAIKGGSSSLKIAEKKRLKHVIKKQKKKDVRFLQGVKKLFGIQILSQVLYTH